MGKIVISENVSLLGRRSYEFFAATWPSRGGALADQLNSLPKYVVSSTLEEPDWNNSPVVSGEVVEEVSRLKQRLDGDVLCSRPPSAERASGRARRTESPGLSLGALGA